VGVQTKALLGKLQVAEQARAQQSQEGQRTSISSGVYPSCSRYRCSDSFSNRWRSSVLFRPPAASRLASSLPISSGSRLYQSLMHCAARARACRATLLRGRAADLCAVAQAPPLRAVVVPLVQPKLQVEGKIPLKVAAPCAPRQHPASGRPAALRQQGCGAQSSAGPRTLSASSKSSRGRQTRPAPPA